jgi:hypothetical protein
MGCVSKLPPKSLVSTLAIDCLADYIIWTQCGVVKVHVILIVSQLE